MQNIARRDHQNQLVPMKWLKTRHRAHDFQCTALPNRKTNCVSSSCLCAASNSTVPLTSVFSSLMHITSTRGEKKAKNPSLNRIFLCLRILAKYTQSFEFLKKIIRLAQVRESTRTVGYIYNSEFCGRMSGLCADTLRNNCFASIFNKFCF